MFSWHKYLISWRYRLSIPNNCCRRWLWKYWQSLKMLRSGGWNTKSPWATFAPLTTTTRLWISKCQDNHKELFLRRARNLPEIWHVFSRRAKKEGPGLIYLDNFSSIEIRYYWDVHGCSICFLLRLLAIPSRLSLKPTFPFPDWSWQWAPVLCSSRESKICAWKIWISSQGGIEGGAGEHIAQDRCHSFCVWCTRACFTCQPGIILKLLN